MRKFLILTRAIIDTAVSLHLMMLTMACKAADRAHARKKRITDAALTSVQAAKQSVAYASADLVLARNAESNSRSITAAIKSGAQSEAASLRRGAVIA
jgi:hypothetical protein